MMMAEIIKDSTTIRKTSDMTSEQVPVWAKRVKAQRTQKAMLMSIQDNKEFDMTKHTMQNIEKMSNSQIMSRSRCQYYGMVHEWRRCSAFGKRCTGCTD